MLYENNIKNRDGLSTFIRQGVSASCQPFVAIPTGQRPQKAEKAIRAWSEIFPVAVYAWDNETYDMAIQITPYVIRGERLSFAKAQNLMADYYKGWSGMICGADDLFPDDVRGIKRMVELYQGKLLWVRDGLFNEQPTHPIVTRQWYEKEGQIFDEQFKHNFCDTDLFVRASKDYVKCFNISFDHRHPLKTNEPLDDIYRYGNDTYREDEMRFNEKYKDCEILERIGG